MNKRTILPIAAIVGASVLALSAVFTVRGAHASLLFGGGVAVPHQIVFDKGDITEFVNDSGYCIAEVAVTTDAGNQFVSTSIVIQDHTAEGPKRGGASDDYLFLIHHCNWKGYYPDPTTVFTIDFEMKVDVAESVTATVTRTAHYDDGKGGTSDNVETEVFLLVSDEDNLEYLMEYTFTFTKVEYEYVTIDAITINYSCTY